MTTKQSFTIDPDAPLTIAAFSRLGKISAFSINRWQNEEALPKDLTLRRAVQWLCKRRDQSSPAKRSSLVDEQVKKMRRENLVAMKALIPFDDVRAAILVINSVLKDHLDGLPQQIAPGDQAMQERIEDALIKFRNEVAHLFKHGVVEGLGPAQDDAA